MIVSVQLAQPGPRAALGVLRAPPRPERTPGLLWAQPAVTVPLGGPRVPTGVALLSAWDDEAALDAFVADGSAVGAALAGGYAMRMDPVRTVGTWPALPTLADASGASDAEEPMAVITLAHVRPRRVLPFIRASSAAERLARDSPALLLGTAMALPPTFVATFSVWRSVREMRAYTTGRDVGDGHVAAMRAHAAEPFHSASAFARFRPTHAHGAWRGLAPLAGEPAVAA